MTIVFLILKNMSNFRKNDYTKDIYLSFFYKRLILDLVGINMKKKKVNIDDNILIKKKKSTKSTNNYKRNTKQQYNKNQVKNEKVKKDSIKEKI